MRREHIFVMAGSGSMVIKMDLPLHDDIQHQLTKGELRRVNEDGTPWEPDPDDSAPPTEAADVAELRDEHAALLTENAALLTENAALSDELALVTKQRDEAIQDEESAAAKPPASKAKTATR